MKEPWLLCAVLVVSLGSSACGGPGGTGNPPPTPAATPTAIPPTPMGQGSDKEHPAPAEPHQTATGDLYWVYDVVATRGLTPVPTDLAPGQPVCIYCPTPIASTHWSSTMTISLPGAIEIDLSLSALRLGCRACPSQRTYRLK